MFDTPTQRRESMFVLEEGGVASDDAMRIRKKTLISVPVLLQSAKERDQLPQEVWDDLGRNGTKIYFSLMFLSAAVMWAYYSCLSAQDFYSVQFPTTDFAFLTTIATSWPAVFGLSVQLVFGLDRKISQSTRFATGFLLFMAMAICIMGLSAVQWENETLGATLVLVCIGVTGLANSIPQSVLYSVAALFPSERFTTAVQIGNVGAGVVNVTLNTVLRLLVGGIDQTAGSQQLSFYLFFSMLIVICMTALVVYRRLTQLYCVQYLLARSTMFATQQEHSMDTVRSRVANLARAFKLVAGPAIAQFVLYFVSLFVYPGVGCAAGRILAQDDVAGKWYCSPGVIGSFSFGDALGRVVCTAAVYRIFTMPRSVLLIGLRIVFIPLLLLNVHGSSLYVFGEDATAPLLYGLVMNMLVGLTGGLLGTVTMGAAPLLVGPEDRGAVSSVMVWFLFLGLSCGSLAGYIIHSLHVFGL